MFGFTRMLKIVLYGLGIYQATIQLLQVISGSVVIV